MKKILLKTSQNGEYYFVIVARNGKVLCTSETYTRKDKCIRTAKIISESRSSFVPIFDGDKKTSSH